MTSETHWEMDRYLHIRPTNQKPDESMTSSKPTNQRGSGFINEWILNWWKSLITSVLYLNDITPPRSSSDFGRSRKNYSNCRECTAGHLLRNVNVTSSITPAKLNDNRAERTTHLIINSFTIEVTLTQTTVTNKSTTSCRQRSIYVVRTLNGRWKLTECAHRPTNGHRHHYYLSNEQLTIIDVIRFRKAASPVVFVL